jgi:hypothetical protein
VLPDPLVINQFQNPVAVPVEGLGLFHNPAQGVPRHVAEVPGVKQRLHRPARGDGEDLSLRSEQLEPVPLGRIMAGRDLDAARRVKPAHGQAAGRRRRHAQVRDLAAGLQ